MISFSISFNMRDTSTTGQLEVWAANVHLVKCKLPEERSDIFAEKALTLFRCTEDPDCFVIKQYDLLKDFYKSIVTVDEICKKTIEYLKNSRSPLAAKRVLRALTNSLPVWPEFTALLAIKDEPKRVLLEDTNALLRRYLAFRKVKTSHEFHLGSEHTLLLEKIKQYWSSLPLFGKGSFLDEHDCLPMELTGLFKEAVKERVVSLRPLTALSFDHDLPLVEEAVRSLIFEYCKRTEEESSNLRFRIVPFSQKETGSHTPHPYIARAFADYMRKNPLNNRVVTFAHYDEAILDILPWCEQVELNFTLTDPQMAEVIKLLSSLVNHRPEHKPVSLLLHFTNEHLQRFLALSTQLRQENKNFFVFYGDDFAQIFHGIHYLHFVEKAFEDNSEWVFYHKNALFKFYFVELIKMRFSQDQEQGISSIKPVVFDDYQEALEEVIPYVEQVVLHHLDQEKALHLVNHLEKISGEGHRLPDLFTVTCENEEVLAVLGALMQPKSPFEDGLYAIQRSDDPAKIFLISTSWQVRNKLAQLEESYALYPFLKPVREGEARPSCVRPVDHQRAIATNGTIAQREAGKVIADKYEALFKKKTGPLVTSAQRSIPTTPKVVINGGLYRKTRPQLAKVVSSSQQESRDIRREVRQNREVFLNTLEEQAKKPSEI